MEKKSTTLENFIDELWDKFHHVLQEVWDSAGEVYSGYNKKAYSSEINSVTNMCLAANDLHDQYKKLFQSSDDGLYFFRKEISPFLNLPGQTEIDIQLRLKYMNHIGAKLLQVDMRPDDAIALHNFTSEEDEMIENVTACVLDVKRYGGTKAEEYWDQDSGTFLLREDQKTSIKEKNKIVLTVEQQIAAVHFSLLASVLNGLSLQYDMNDLKKVMESSIVRKYIIVKRDGRSDNQPSAENQSIGLSMKKVFDVDPNAFVDPSTQSEIVITSKQLRKEKVKDDALSI